MKCIKFVSLKKTISIQNQSHKNNTAQISSVDIVEHFTQSQSTSKAKEKKEKKPLYIQTNNLFIIIKTQKRDRTKAILVSHKQKAFLLFVPFLIRKNLAVTQNAIIKISAVQIIRMGSESVVNRNGNGGGGGGVKAVKEVVTTAKNVVAAVKEIVNCTEQEIYDVLRECDMDPNLAVEKLLSQGFSIFENFYCCMEEIGEDDEIGF